MGRNGRVPPCTTNYLGTGQLAHVGLYQLMDASHPASRRFIVRKLFSIAAIAAVAFTFVNVTAGQAATASSVAPYVDMGEWPTPVLSTMAGKGGVKSFTLGFVTSFGCKASWFGAYDPRT